MQQLDSLVTPATAVETVRTPQLTTHKTNNYELLTYIYVSKMYRSSYVSFGLRLPFGRRNNNSYKGFMLEMKHGRRRDAVTRTVRSIDSNRRYQTVRPSRSWMASITGSTSSDMLLSSQ